MHYPINNIHLYKLCNFKMSHKYCNHLYFLKHSLHFDHYKTFHINNIYHLLDMNFNMIDNSKIGPKFNIQNIQIP